MIYSNRTYSHNDIKKIIKDSKRPPSRPNCQARNVLLASQENCQEIQNFVQAIREHEVKILQLRNDLLKKQIEGKDKTQRIKDLQKQVTALRKQKQHFTRTKQKFEKQRQQKSQKILQLEQQNQQLLDKLHNMPPPKDRYETCMRQLDELKTNIESKEDVARERDLYKFFYEEIRELVVGAEFSAEEVRGSLRAFFGEMDQKVKR